jgi:hypothetical protein
MNVPSAMLVSPKGSFVVGSGEGFDQGGEFEDFDMGRAIGPVVAPADDDVAAGEKQRAPFEAQGRGTQGKRENEKRRRGVRVGCLSARVRPLLQ